MKMCGIAKFSQSKWDFILNLIPKQHYYVVQGLFMKPDSWLIDWLIDPRNHLWKQFHVNPGNFLSYFFSIVWVKSAIVTESTDPFDCI